MKIEIRQVLDVRPESTNVRFYLLQESKVLLKMKQVEDTETQTSVNGEDLLKAAGLKVKKNSEIYVYAVGLQPDGEFFIFQTLQEILKINKNSTLVFKGVALDIEVQNVQ